MHCARAEKMRENPTLTIFGKVSEYSDIARGSARAPK